MLVMLIIIIIHNTGCPKILCHVVNKTNKIAQFFEDRPTGYRSSAISSFMPNDAILEEEVDVNVFEDEDFQEFIGAVDTF